MKTKIIYSLILALSMFFVVGCGSDDKENPIVDNTGPYAFFNATTPLEIERIAVDENGTVIENGGYTIAVQLLKNGLVEPGEIIQMLPFDFKYGFITEIVVTTTTNGYAVFTYVPPENYSDIVGQDITIQAVYIDASEDVNVIVDPDKEREVLLTQDFILQFR